MDRSPGDAAGEGRERCNGPLETVAGCSYRVLRYAERLQEAEAIASVGFKGDSCDNAMVQALNSPDGIWKPSSCTGHRRRIPRHQGTDVEFVVLAEPLVEAGEGRVTMRVHERESEKRFPAAPGPVRRQPRCWSTMAP